MVHRTITGLSFAACLALSVAAGTTTMAGGRQAGEKARAGATDRRYDLKYGLKKGQQFALRNMYVGNTYLKRGETTSKVAALTRDLELSYRVLSADERGLSVEVEYRRKIYRNTGADGATVVTDFAPIVGRKVKYTISPTGELGGFEGFKEMPGVPMPGGWTYDGPRYQEELEHMFLTLPAQPVGKGDSWKRTAFGVRFDYTLIDEVRLFGRNCVRIFAKIEDEQTRSTAKDRDGNPVNVERSEPYSDIYYFDYENGMMVSRFSVASLGQQIVTDQKGAVLQHQVTDRLYETFVTLQ